MKQDDNFNRYALHHWPTHFFFFIMRLIAWLPYPVIYRIGEAFGLLMYKLVKARTRIARVNIQLCYPHLSENEQEALVRKNLIATGVGMLETAMLWFGPKRRWSDIVEVEGMEHYEKAKSDGKGGLLLSFHLTSLEIGGSLLGTQIPIAALYRKNEKPLIEEAMVNGRKQYVHPIPRQATREMVRWIKDNGFVWYAADQDYGRKQSIFVPFYGISTATITATTRFAKLTKAPVIPMTQERIGRGKKIRVTLHPPMEGMGKDEHVDALTINTFLEQYLNTHPEDYLWVHRRFKTRPNEDDPSLYPKKKKARAVTPERYKNILEAAEWIETKDNKPSRLLYEQGLVVFFYRDKRIGSLFSPAYKHFIHQTPEIEHDGIRYRHQGLVRYCESQNCDLVYYEAIE